MEKLKQEAPSTGVRTAANVEVIARDKVKKVSGGHGHHHHHHKSRHHAKSTAPSGGWPC